MTHFLYESRSKEKIKDLREEGMRSQAFHRSGAPKLDSLRNSLPKLILLVLGTLGVLEFLIR